MKINRFIALAAIALLVVGAMGFVSYRTFAQSGPTPTASDCVADTEDDGAAEAAESGPDTDDIQDECGNQAKDEANEANGADEAQEGAEANESGESNETAPAGTAISADQAQAIVEDANPGATALGVEYESDGGTGVWEVELDNDQDVRVDAATGEILLTESGD